MIFDNAKVRSVVPDYVATIPFAQGAQKIVAWHDEDPSRQKVDARMDELMDQLVDAFRTSPTTAQSPPEPRSAPA